MVEQPHRERAERTENHHSGRDIDGRAAARHVPLFVEVGRRDFVERDGRGQCGQGQQDEEDERPEVAERKLLEDVGQRDEDQLGACRRGDAEAEDGGEDHYAGQDGNKRVEQGDLQGGCLQVGAFAEIGGVGDEASHADAEREEGLAHGAERDGAAHFREVGLEEEAQACACVRQRQRAHAERTEDQEEHGHHQLRGALDAFLHATHNDDVRHDDEGGRPQDRTERVGREELELLCEVGGRLARQGARAGLQDVFERPACDNGVEAQDEEGGQHAVVADEAPFRARGQLLEGSRNVAPRVAADEKLGDHHGQAEQEDTDDIDDEEGGSAVFAHHVGETPDVSQAYGAAYGGEYGAEFATECSSVVRCHS